MTTYSACIQTALALMIFGGFATAEAGVIGPVDATGAPLPNPTVTVSIFDLSGQDVTDTWLPTWRPPGPGTAVYIAFNSQGAPATPAPITLVPPILPVVFNGQTNPFVAALTTSAYPGQCTNFGSETDLSPDYQLGTQETIPGTGRAGFLLTPMDCGGIAVILATVGGTPYRFVLPKDTNRNGIPDVWEATYCPNNACPVGTEDVDAGPAAGSPTGDGLSAFDEYRGFIVSGQHVSGDPRQRDLFVHLVNAQCGSAAEGLLGGGTKTYPTQGNGGLFDNLLTLIPGSQVHLLGYSPSQENYKTEEWVDHFHSFSQQTGFQYVVPGTNTTPPTLTSAPPLDDRRINKNFVLRPVVPNVTVSAVQKGLRVTECLDTSAASPLGTTGIGSTNGPDNSLIYTKRIVEYITPLFSNATKPNRVFAFVNGAWTVQTPPNGAVDLDFVLSQAMKFYIAHELTHSTRLTPTTNSSGRTSYGYHYAPMSGSVMDQAIVYKLEKNFSSFYIPTVYNNSDKSTYKIRD